MYNENGKWIVQVVVTVALAALAAFGGMRAGLSEAREQVAAIQSSQDAMSQRLDRIESKLDRVIERRR